MQKYLTILVNDADRVIHGGIVSADEKTIARITADLAEATGNTCDAYAFGIEEIRQKVEVAAFIDHKVPWFTTPGDAPR